jgi:hypothetical protein
MKRPGDGVVHIRLSAADLIILLIIIPVAS